MDEYDHDEETVSDDSLNRELAVLLSAKPSVEFVARVRARVASQPQMRPPWLNAGWAFVTLALVVAIGAAIVMRDRQPLQSFAAASVAAPAATDEHLVVPDEAQTSAPTVSDVLVSPSESRVVQRLLTAARGAAVIPSPASPASAADLLPPMPIAIAPITLEPLAAAADLESGVVQ